MCPRSNEQFTSGPNYQKNDKGMFVKITRVCQTYNYGVNGTLKKILFSKENIEKCEDETAMLRNPTCGINGFSMLLHNNKPHTICTQGDHLHCIFHT